MKPLLTVSDLKTYFYTDKGEIRILDGLNLVINEGEILGLVGESGSGKSLTAFSILRLLQPPGRVVGGEIHLNGENLLELSEKEMQKVRGSQISMIFQNPRESLNPVVKVEKQLGLVFQAHQKKNKRQSYEASLDLLKQLHLPDPKKVMNSYPHQLSGGMCQRVMIALAIASRPKLLIVDEATTALDVTIQFQIINLLRYLRDSLKLTELVITHDLGVVAELCDKVAVMYAGEIVEFAPVEEIFHEPKHPYTQGLISSSPQLGVGQIPDRIPGEVPGFSNLPAGCRFHPRCPFVYDRCSSETPKSYWVGETHWANCFLLEQDSG